MKNIGYLIRVTLAVLIVAFVARPTMAALHNSDTALSGQTQNHFKTECAQAFLPLVSLFHKVSSEVPDFPELTQDVSRTKLPSLLGSRLKMVLVSPSIFPKSSLILRI